MLGRLILLIAFLVAAVTIIHLFRSTPRSNRRSMYWKFGLSAAAIVLVLLAVTGRIPLIGAAIGAALPFVRQAIPVLIRYFPLIRQWQRSRPQPAPAGGNSSKVNTPILQMTLDHDSNRLYGDVIKGPYAGSALDSLQLPQLQDLLSYCHREDKDSARLLLTYLNHRFGNDWQQQQATPPPGDGTLNEEAAYAILGLRPGADRSEIIAAHRRMMQKMHPDRGGSDYLAAQINQAKDLLLKKVA